MGWLSGQFTTRVIVLMPVAIAINIVLGYTVQSVLRLPIYLDSIGTIFVGVLAGPIAGLLTGVLTNLIWQYAPVIGGGTIGPFAITAGVIGLLAGVYLDPEQGGFIEWAVPAAIVIGIVVAAFVAGFIYLRRDLAGLWVAGAGLFTGIVAAIVSAPIAAIVFEGVTGSGTDLIVAALRQGGADVLQASLGQGFISDPIDKIITSFVVFLILANLSPRFLARFPLGEKLVRPAPASSAD